MSEPVGHQAPTVSSEELGDELSLFDSASGTAVALNGTARDIWSLVDGEATFDEVVATLASRLPRGAGDDRGGRPHGTGPARRGGLRHPSLSMTSLRLLSAHVRVDLVGVERLPATVTERVRGVLDQLEVASGSDDDGRRRPAVRVTDPGDVLHLGGRLRCRQTRTSPRRRSWRPWIGPLLAATSCLTLHAAVVAGPRGAAIVPAVSGAGKSTLAGACQQARPAPGVRRGSLPRPGPGRAMAAPTPPRTRPRQPRAARAPTPG